MAQQTLTQPGGPLVSCARSLEALFAIRREKLIPQMFEAVTVSRSCFDRLSKSIDAQPSWMHVLEDQPDVQLPERLAGIEEDSASAIKLGLALGASEILLEGIVKEKAKLSFIKSQGVVSILVTAHRQGELTAVKPMIKALTALGFEDVLPAPDLLEALYTALDNLSE